MGSYYTSCEHCGFELCARWNWDEDSPDQVEPKEVGRRRKEHLDYEGTNCQEIRRLKAEVARLEKKCADLEELVNSYAGVAMY